MPRVPRAPDAIQIAPLPGVRQETIAGPELFTAGQRQAQGVVNAADRVIDAGAKIRNDMQDRADADAVFRVEAQNDEAILGFQTAAKQRTGKNAEGVVKDADAFFTKLESDALAKAEGPRQTKLVGQGIAKRRQQMLEWAAGHEAGERRRSLNEATLATLETNVSLAAANAFDEKMTGELRAESLRRLEAHAKLNGLDDAAAARAREESLSKFHMGVLQARADKDLAAAERYFASYKDEIDGTMHDDVTDLFKRAKAESTVAAKQQVEAAQKQASDEAWQHYSERGKLPPIGVLRRMDGKDRQALQDKQKADQKGEPVKTDVKAYLDVRQMASSDPAKFARIDLRTYAGTFSTEDIKQLQGMQEAITKGTTGEVLSFERQLAGTHTMLGFKPTDREKIWDFDRRATQAVFDEQRRVGKALSQEEKQVVLDRLILEGSITRPGWFDDSKGRVYELQNEQDFDKFVPEIPDDERTLLVERFKKKGVTPTEEQILSAYKAWKRL